MRENRPYGSEGGVAISHPYPYRQASTPGRLHERPFHWCFYRKSVPRQPPPLTLGLNCRDDNSAYTLSP